MAKAKVAFVCADCGAEHTKWQGQCATCGEWNTLREFILPKTSQAGGRGQGRAGYSGDSPRSARLTEISTADHRRIPSGFAELDRRRKDEVELVHLGMIPEYAGRGLGTYLLGWAVDQAWSKPARRVWTRTSNHDHPKAIAVFQRAGFVPYDQESGLIDDPRRAGAMPPGQEFS